MKNFPKLEPFINHPNLDVDRGEQRLRPHATRGQVQEWYYPVRCLQCNEERWLRVSEVIKYIESSCKTCRIRNLHEENRLRRLAQPSAIEQKMIDYLKKHNVLFLREFSLQLTTLRVYIDFALPLLNENLAFIELNGYHHQQNSVALRRDDLLDLHLMHSHDKILWLNIERNHLPIKKIKEFLKECELL